MKFFEEIKLQKNCKINSAHEMFLELVEMTFGLVYASFIQLARLASFKNDFLCTLTSHDDGNFGTHVKMCRFRSLEASNFDHFWHQPSQTIWLSFFWRLGGVGRMEVRENGGKFRRHCAAAGRQICKPCRFIVY